MWRNQLEVDTWHGGRVTEGRRDELHFLMSTNTNIRRKRTRRKVRTSVKLGKKRRIKHMKN